MLDTLISLGRSGESGRLNNVFRRSPWESQIDCATFVPGGHLLSA